MTRSYLGIALSGVIFLLGGCVPQSRLPPSGAGAEPVTFNNQIVRIFQRRCQVCHRPGEVAPFSLLTYRDAHPWRQRILEAVRARRMPPWKAAPGHGEFADVRRLSEVEIDLVARWVEAGAPEGEPRDLPSPVKFPTEWTLGRPGLILAPKEEFTVPARSRDLYRCFTVPVRVGENRFIQASEVLPGNRKIVHHVVTFLDATGRSLELDGRDGRPGYTCFGGPGFQTAGGLGGWSPGAPPLEIPSGVAWGIPPGAHLVIQVHYHNPGDTAETDRTRVGIHFARPPFDSGLYRVRVWTWNFWIPPGATRHRVVARYTLAPGERVEATSIHAHMHLLGREVKVTARYPDGTVRPLLYIDNWDFNWQLRYTYKKPIPLTEGTVVEAECFYDNSAGNPHNPNSPPRVVTSGFETTDEMCVVSILGTASLSRR